MTPAGAGYQGAVRWRPRNHAQSAIVVIFMAQAGPTGQAGAKRLGQNSPSNDARIFHAASPGASRDQLTASKLYGALANRRHSAVRTISRLTAWEQPYCDGSQA